MKEECMSFEEFAESFAKDVKAKFLTKCGLEVDASIRNVCKLNTQGVVISVAKKGSRIGASVPMESIYQNLKNGMRYEELVEKVVDDMSHGVGIVGR